MSDSWHSYPSIYNLGHAAIKDLLTVPVYVEEKVDGSQFSACVEADGELLVRSKGKQMDADAPEKMFSLGVETVKSLKDKMTPGWTYRCEYLSKPKHNTLAYERAPNGHIILFDVNTDHEQYLSYEDKKTEAERLGLEVVPLLYSGVLDNIDFLNDLLDGVSILGGQKIEGVVIKPMDYAMFGRDKKVLMGKFVSPAFKEKHTKEWKNQNPSSNDVLGFIGQEYRTEARWEKAVNHLRDDGRLENSLRDIGNIMKEVPADIEKECIDEIKDRLWKWAWPHIRRKVTAGCPEWYKDRLAKSQFEE